MQWKTFGLILLAAGHGSTQAAQGPPTDVKMMRFSCTQLVIDRIDPLVNPGLAPSPHLHQFVGGNSLNTSMDPATHDLPTASSCTTCTFSEDFSNYWSAVLFFRARNGTFKRVPQAQEIGLTGNGGITVYYIPSMNAKKSVTAFKPGFRMLNGDAASRSAASTPRKICHRCMPTSGDNSNINCGPPDTETLPSEPCVGGIRTVITFPTCWDGKNLDTPDHMSHLAYANGSKPYDVGPTGDCPATHPVVVPQVMFEIRWQTDEFSSKDLWPEDGSQPFVWSTGDSHGYSLHADYVFGWKGDALQRALDNRCTGNTCDQLKTQTVEESNKCTKSRIVDEESDGWLSSIPGNPMSM